MALTYTYLYICIRMWKSESCIHCLDHPPEENEMMRSETERNVYRKLYEITAQNSEKGGIPLPFHWEAVQAALDEGTDVADLFDFIDQDGEDFLTSAYITILKRMPDETAKASLLPQAKSLSRLEFQQKVLTEIFMSKEYRTKSSVLNHNVFSPHSS